MAEKKISEMSISDVLKTQVFFDMVQSEIKSILKSRDNASVEARKNNKRLKKHPIDDLRRSGELETGKFIVNYAKVINKQETGFSAAKRDTIKDIGNIVFHKAMKVLIEVEEKGFIYEAKGKDSDGNH